MQIAIVDDDLMFSKILYKNINTFMERLFRNLK